MEGAMKSLFITCALALVASAACNESRLSVSPDPIPPANPTPPVTATNTVAGVVTTAAGVPEAGARVFLVDEAGAAIPGLTAVTDGNGYYQIDRLAGSPFFG